MNIQETLDSLKSINFNELEINNLGGWPNPVKVLLVIAVFLVVLVLGYSFYLGDINTQLDTQATEENALIVKFEKKAHETANLDDYKKQMADIQISLSSELKKLPSNTEVPGLLDELTKFGISNGLEFREIKPLPEKVEQFYVELPINLSMSGSYHDFGNFVAEVSRMDRIVTLHDFDIKPDKEAGSSLLVMNVLAKTYRYNESGIKSQDETGAKP